MNPQNASSNDRGNSSFKLAEPNYESGTSIHHDDSSKESSKKK